MTDYTSPSGSETDIIIGRDKVYARLQQHILDPARRHAIVFTGHTGMGKTALLRHFSAVFDDPFLAIMLSLGDDEFKSPHDIVQAAIDGILIELAESNFSLSRVPHVDDHPEMGIHDWFKDIFLPDVFGIIRPHRRIVLLLDDAEQLIPFGTDTIGYWHSILTDIDQFAIVMTLHTDHEHLLPQLAPLVAPIQADRLRRLSEEDSIDLIRQYAPGARDQIVTTIYNATGGHPQVLTYYGQSLHRYWADHNDSEAYEKAMVDTYRASQADFRALWLKLTRDERLVLTAIASLIYDDPLQAVTSKRIETWLIETDYLLDIVTINAALRGLDYQDIVSHKVGENIELTMTLMQQWLLEQARIDDTVSEQRGQLPIRLIVIAGVIILILIALVLWIPPLYVDSTQGIATATLST